jgi:opacity protein-like surface antigen
MHGRILAALGAALCLGTVVAQADDGNPLQTPGLIYFGGGLSKDKVDGIANPGVPFGDLDKTSWKLLAGVRPVRVFAVEADYLDLGNRTETFIDGATQHVDAKAFAGYGVGFLPLPVPWLDVFGKAGVARWKLDANETPGTFPPSSFFAISNRGTEFAWGLGAQALFRNIGARLEWERFEIPNTDNGARVFSLDLILSFP